MNAKCYICCVHGFVPARFGKSLCEIHLCSRQQLFYLHIDMCYNRSATLLHKSKSGGSRHNIASGLSRQCLYVSESGNSTSVCVCARVLSLQYYRTSAHDMIYRNFININNANHRQLSSIIALFFTVCTFYKENYAGQLCHNEPD